MDKKELRKKDLFASLILLGIGIWVFIESLKMIFVDLPGVKTVGWFVAPGVFPIILSIGLILMSCIILAIAVKESGGIKKGDWERIKKYLKSKDFLIILSEVGLLFLYIFVLLGRVHFIIATAVYLFLSMFIVKASAWYKLVIISIAISVGVAYLFGNLFKIPLP